MESLPDPAASAIEAHPASSTPYRVRPIHGLRSRETQDPAQGRAEGELPRAVPEACGRKSPASKLVELHRSTPDFAGQGTQVPRRSSRDTARRVLAIPLLDRYLSWSPE